MYILLIIIVMVTNVYWLHREVSPLIITIIYILTILSINTYI